MPALSATRCVTCAKAPAPGARRRTATRVAVPHHPSAPLLYREEAPAALPVEHTRVLPLLADVLQAQALTRRFENFAGRTAMIAAAAALAAELALPTSDGVFGWAASSDLATQLAALGSLMLCCAVGLAARTHGGPTARHALLEPVLASLTSGRRSFSGYTQRNVDRAVDYLVESVFTPRFLRQHFEDPEDKYI